MLLYFTKSLFGKSKIRLRPSYFPFTEPSAEVDIYWGLETETDYRITKGTGWLEIMGCGMVDPNVLSNCGIDPEKYSGYAFGMGIERIAMLLFRKRCPLSQAIQRKSLAELITELREDFFGSPPLV